jgi:hypothetical protein
MRTCGRRTPDGGSDVTTSGSWRLFSALSMAENSDERRPLSTNGVDSMRWAWAPQLGQGWSSAQSAMRIISRNDPQSLQK